MIAITANKLPVISYTVAKQADRVLDIKLDYVI